MPEQLREVSPTPQPRVVKTQQGQLLTAPDHWELLPPGDAALSRRVKAAGPCWLVREPKGRKVFSRGIWAPKDRIELLRQQLAIERDDPAYLKKLEAGRRRRAVEQEKYAEDFEAAIVAYLAFHCSHEALAKRLARAISKHAVPVGSGTVARTKRIAIEQRAEAATIAWMRHQTTAYDDMKIERVKGRRREVRRLLAQRSKRLLDGYRAGRARNPDAACPLESALQHSPPQ